MAVHKSAQKRIRRNDKRRVVNKMRLSRTRTFVRKVLEAVAAGDQVAARDALRVAQPELHRSAAKGVIHLKKASRILSRLSARIKAMA